MVLSGRIGLSACTHMKPRPYPTQVAGASSTRPNASSRVRAACRLGCEGIVSKRLGSPYGSGRSKYWMKVKNPKAPAVSREVEEDWDA